MKNKRVTSLLCLVGLGMISLNAQAGDEDAFLTPIRSASEQTLGQNKSALWTFHLVATQYQPLQPTPEMQSALKAQSEARFLDALITLDEAAKGVQAGSETEAELNLLRASFLLQGNQPRQTIQLLSPLLEHPKHAADAYALTAMAHLQQGKSAEALDTAQKAHDLQGGVLPHLAKSYALQGAGRLTEARDAVHQFNARTPQSAIALAREAELALTLDQIQAAKALVNQAGELDPAHPYVIAVSGLTYLIEGKPQPAKSAFETALQRNPKDAKALLGLGLAEIKLGHFQAGQDKLQAANDAEPNNALILTYLGRSQQHLGQTEAARASWRSAQLADPKDPIPWLYQAQAELQANRPLDARESLREAQARTSNRTVYRGESLLREDEQLLQANLAEIQRQLGLDSIAFHTLSDSVSEKNSANLRNQADLLQGQRFGESARRSLLLQSLFNERPGNMPAALDIYGDGAGLTGASTPQHGVVSGLNSQQISFNNYDELFSQPSLLEADATTGNKNSNENQVRLGVGNEKLGLGVAQLQFKTDGFAPFDNLDNRVEQAVLQLRPSQSTQVFVSYQSFSSNWAALFVPAQLWSYSDAFNDGSQITRLGFRQILASDSSSELRGLWSIQNTDRLDTGYSMYSGSNAHSEELQYSHSGVAYATQWGVQQYKGRLIIGAAPGDASYGDNTQNVQQVYVAWQQMLNPAWQLDTGLGLGRVDNQDSVTPSSSTSLAHWLPKLGVVYTPDSATHLRLATWQSLSVVGVGDATLAPVSLAGFLLPRPSDTTVNGKLIKAVALVGDRQLNASWLLAAESQQRKVDEPTIDGTTGVQFLVWQQVDESRLALHWQPQGNPLSVGLINDYERIQNDPNAIAFDSIDGQSLHSQQLTMRWFANSQWTVNWVWSHNQVDYTQQLSFAPLVSSPSYQNSFNQLDADLSWKFSQSKGLLTAGVRNAFDKRFQYAEIDLLNPRFSKGRQVYAKLKMAW